MKLTITNISHILITVFVIAENVSLHSEIKLRKVSLKIIPCQYSMNHPIRTLALYSPLTAVPPWRAMLRITKDAPTKRDHPLFSINHLEHLIDYVNKGNSDTCAYLAVLHREEEESETMTICPRIQYRTIMTTYCNRLKTTKLCY